MFKHSLTKSLNWKSRILYENLIGNILTIGWPYLELRWAFSVAINCGVIYRYCFGNSSADYLYLSRSWMSPEYESTEPNYIREFPSQTVFIISILKNFRPLWIKQAISLYLICASLKVADQLKIDFWNSTDKITNKSPIQEKKCLQGESSLGHL